jgi:signal transduction histidine kinase
MIQWRCDGEARHFWVAFICPMKLRTNLVYLIVGIVIPLVALATLLGLLLVKREREAFRQGAINRNRAFMTAVDAAVRGHISTLQVLASETSLQADDFDAFRRDAVRALEVQHDWQNIILTNRDGTHLINTARDGQEPLDGTTDLKSLKAVIEKNAPAVGDVTIRQYSGKYGIAVRVPVQQHGKLAYVLSAIIDLDQFRRLIDEQQLPRQWVSGLIDATGHYIARVPYRSSAEMASSDFRKAVANSREGWYRGLTLEGRDSFTAHLTSDLTNWSIGVGIPEDEVNAGANRAAWIIAAGTLITLALALGFSYWMGRRITLPIASLAKAARAMGQDTNPKVPSRSTIKEVRELAQAFADANAAIQERQMLFEREQAALKAADRAKDEFLAMLGHELRNPLAAITTSAEVLRFEDPDENISSHALDVIERQTKQMTRLVEDLLDVTKFTMGKVTLKSEDFDLARLSRRVVDTWVQSGRVSEGRIHIHTESVWVNGDTGRVEQVLSNLLDNAVKFSSPEQAIEVRVQAKGDQALLEVSDRGEGIPKELHERLFGLFVQGSRGPDRARGGLGLGLALVRRIVEMHGGSIVVTSDGAGKGSTFTARFPAIAAPRVGTEIDENKSGQTDSQKILIVEDNDDTREMMEAMLSLEGHQVRVAAHGATAIDDLKSDPADVVLLDIGLPDLDGYEVARRVRELAGERVKLIALTGYGQAEDQRRAYEAGFDFHLTKPVALDKLREILSK